MYCIEGRRKDGRKAWIGRDLESGGWPYFAERAWDANLIHSATSAKAILAGVAKMGSYFNGDRMDLASFQVHEAVLETKPVTHISGEMRAVLSRTDSRTPAGWRYLVTDASGWHFATPERLWSPTTTDVNDALRTTSLAGAVEALDRMKGDGWRLVIAHVKVDPAPLTKADLDARISLEEAAQAEAEQDADLSGVDVYKPTF